MKKGEKMSEDQKNKISNSLIGHKISLKTRNKIRKTLLGNIPWNKGIKNFEISGEKHPNWKGESAGYYAKHSWIKKQFGSPNYCEHCKTKEKRMYHWSNISGKYLRIISDWQRLCVRCHKKYDQEKNKNSATDQRGVAEAVC